MSNKRIFWIAGENSGDLHASIVLKELKKRELQIDNFGIGGSKMEAYDFKPVFPFQRFSVMGFIEVVKHLSFFLKVEKKIKEIFSTTPPDLVVVVDYPGLNMRIAKMASKMNIPVLYFICPQFWAWKYNRIFKLKKYTDHIAYILPFEEKYFQKHLIKATYVGHPIAEEIEVKLSRDEMAKNNSLAQDKKWIGFLPGSRNLEIKKMLPEYLKAIKKFDHSKYEFLISKAPTVSDKLMKKMIGVSGVTNIKTIEHQNYEMMKHCDLLVVTSGTATIETAYTGTPFIIVYKTSKSSYELGKRFIKIGRIGLPNIVLDKDIIPELIQDEASGERIYDMAMSILDSPEEYDRITSELKNLHEVLGSRSTSVETANIIERMLYA
ncbi:MAG: lipid-A-disaccharide synthase [Candidatus Cloacimonetes bacterium]|nr:lipid-A-disaccharide synthase [Candidatus Cloacimonadota bacterium]MBL7148661.1 lipid-A-disaccharide synthase [Candidatus Cloacimonadota bacterium]